MKNLYVRRGELHSYIFKKLAYFNKPFFSVINMLQNRSLCPWKAPKKLLSGYDQQIAVAPVNNLILCFVVPF